MQPLRESTRRSKKRHDRETGEKRNAGAPQGPHQAVLRGGPGSTFRAQRSGTTKTTEHGTHRQNPPSRRDDAIRQAAP